MYNYHCGSPTCPICNLKIFSNTTNIVETVITNVVGSSALQISKQIFNFGKQTLSKEHEKTFDINMSKLIQNGMFQNTSSSENQPTKNNTSVEENNTTHVDENIELENRLRKLIIQPTTSKLSNENIELENRLQMLKNESDDDICIWSDDEEEIINNKESQHA